MQHALRPVRLLLLLLLLLLCVPRSSGRWRGLRRRALCDQLLGRWLQRASLLLSLLLPLGWRPRWLVARGLWRCRWGWLGVTVKIDLAYGQYRPPGGSHPAQP